MFWRLQLLRLYNILFCFCLCLHFFTIFILVLFLVHCHDLFEMQHSSMFSSVGLHVRGIRWICYSSRIMWTLVSTQFLPKERSEVKFTFFRFEQNVSATTVPWNVAKTFMSPSEVVFCNTLFSGATTRFRFWIYNQINAKLITVLSLLAVQFYYRLAHLANVGMLTC